MQKTPCTSSFSHLLTPFLPNVSPVPYNLWMNESIGDWKWSTCWHRSGDKELDAHIILAIWNSIHTKHNIGYWCHTACIQGVLVAAEVPYKFMVPHSMHTWCLTGWASIQVYGASIYTSKYEIWLFIHKRVSMLSFTKGVSSLSSWPTFPFHQTWVLSWIS